MIAFSNYVSPDSYSGDHSHKYLADGIPFVFVVSSNAALVYLVYFILNYVNSVKLCRFWTSIGTTWIQTKVILKKNKSIYILNLINFELHTQGMGIQQGKGKKVEF